MTPLRRLAVPAVLACLATAWMTGCGDTLQDQPVPHNLLEGLIVAPTPVYWLGRSFAGLQITEVSQDVGGAYVVQYGNCKEGGQLVCVAPLRVITSPDNSYLPGGPARERATSVRGAPAVLARGGRTVEIATGPVVVDIIARDPALAAAAARAAVPIAGGSWPAEPLPPRSPDTHFAARPLPVQERSPVRRVQ